MTRTNSKSPQRLVAVIILAALAGCGSGGGGGGAPDAPPTIATASLSGAGNSPEAGDTLILGFSVPVILVSGALLNDQDFVLSSGSTLGDVTLAPSLLSSNTVAVTLGAGVTIAPGTTTIVLSPSNDAISGLTTAPQGGGEPVTINISDGVAPSITNLTAADVDDELNGTGAAGGTLQAPSNGWSIDLTYSDNSAMATAQTVITADVATSTPSGSQPPGTNLRPFLTEVSASNSAASYLLPANVSFPNTTVTLTCIVADVSGLSSAPSSFTLTVKAFTNALRPFETSANPSQIWFVDFSRDLESFTALAAGSGFQIDTNDGPNGTNDFEDLLRILGLTSATPIANVAGADDSNVVVIDRIKSNLLANLENYYSGANVSFTLTQPAGSFNGNSSVNYNSLGYSTISIAGASSTPGVLGIAIFDPSNSSQNDNSLFDFDGQRLGVFLHTIVDSGMGQSAASNFRMTFDPFAPAPGGTPIGNDPQDGDRLNGLTSDGRAIDINTALRDLARFLATVTAHECGHSVGLVTNGAMPTGLYGDDSVNFPGSANGHIRNTSQFPSGSVNLMSPSLSYATAINPSSAFNTLNLAYLREQVFYNGN